MDEELETLKCLEKINDYLNNVYDYKEIKEEIRKDINSIKNTILELKAIKDANPSEALKELTRIENNITYLLSECDINEEVSINFNSIVEHKSCDIIKQAILKAQEQDKVLEVINAKPIESGIAIEQIKKQRDYSQYKKVILETTEAYLLTEEEFDLLKRYLG